jgi:hypothetical protein
MVFVFRGLNDDLLDLKLLPYLLGFRVGMMTNDMAANGVALREGKAVPSERPLEGSGYAMWGRIGEKETNFVT